MLADIKKTEIEISDLIMSQKDAGLELVRMTSESKELGRIYTSTVDNLKEYVKRKNDPEYRKQMERQDREKKRNAGSSISGGGGITGGMSKFLSSPISSVGSSMNFLTGKGSTPADKKKGCDDVENSE
jgi:hypothetical protein